MLNSPSNGSGLPELDSVIDKMIQLNTKLPHLDFNIPKRSYDALVTQFESLNKNVFNKELISLDYNNQLEEIIDILTSISNLDFSREVTVKDEYSHLDYVAISVNLLQEHLTEKIDELKRFRAALSVFEDVYIITDKNGEIISINRTDKKVFGIDISTFESKSIKLFLTSFKLMNKYAIEFTNSVSEHFIEASFIDNPNSNVVLRVTAKPYSDNSVSGYCYRLEEMEKLLSRDRNVHLEKKRNDRKKIDEIEYLKTKHAKLCAKPQLNFEEIRMLEAIIEQLKLRK